MTYPTDTTRTWSSELLPPNIYVVSAPPGTGTSFNINTIMDEKKRWGCVDKAPNAQTWREAFRLQMENGPRTVFFQTQSVELFKEVKELAGWQPIGPVGFRIITLNSRRDQFAEYSPKWTRLSTSDKFHWIVSNTVYSKSMK